MDTDAPKPILYMTETGMTANVDDQSGEAAIAPRQVCGQKLYLFGSASPQPQRYATSNLHLLPDALAGHQIPPAKRLDQSEGHHVGSDRITAGDDDLRRHRLAGPRPPCTKLCRPSTT
jgi:hypothetical protein